MWGYKVGQILEENKSYNYNYIGKSGNLINGHIDKGDKYVVCANHDGKYLDDDFIIKPLTNCHIEGIDIKGLLTALYYFLDQQLPLTEALWMYGVDKDEIIEKAESILSEIL